MRRLMRGWPIAGLICTWYSQRSEDILRKAEEASRHAVELAPESAQAQASRGLALSLNRRDEEAESAFLAALRLDGDRLRRGTSTRGTVL